MNSKVCATCGGSGKIRITVEVRDFYEDKESSSLDINEKCSTCGGTGRVDDGKMIDE